MDEASATEYFGSMSAYVDHEELEKQANMADPQKQPNKPGPSNQPAKKGGTTKKYYQSTLNSCVVCKISFGHMCLSPLMFLHVIGG